MNKTINMKYHENDIFQEGFVADVRNRIGSLLLLLLATVFLSSCAGLNLRPDPQSDVRQAAENYWNARVAGDWVTCYKYEEVSKLQKESLSQYVHHQGNLIYKSAIVKGVEMKGPDKALVQVSLEYCLPAFGTSHAFKTDSKDTWVRIDGKWYHHVEDRLMDKMNR